MNCQENNQSWNGSASVLASMRWLLCGEKRDFFGTRDWNTTRNAKLTTKREDNSHRAHCTSTRAAGNRCDVSDGSMQKTIPATAHNLLPQVDFFTTTVLFFPQTRSESSQ